MTTTTPSRFQGTDPARPTGAAGDLPLRFLGVPAVQVAVTFAAWAALTLVTLSLPNGQWRGAVGELSHSALMIAALWFNLRRARRLPEERVTWSALFVAATVAAVFTFALAIEAIWPDRLVISPAVWLGQTVVSNGAVIVALLTLPYARRSRGGRLRTGIDGVLFATAAFLILWSAGLQALIETSSTSMLMRIEALFTYAANSASLGIVVYLSARRLRQLDGALGWLAIGLGTLTVGTVMVLVGRLNGTFEIGSAAELVQLAAYPCFILAPLAPPTALDGDDASAESTLGDLLTYMPVAVAIGAGLYQMLLTQRVDPVTAIGTPLLAVLLLARQFLTLRDLRYLSATLETRVADRTRELDESRAALIRSQRMEAVGRVAGGVAHDFNNVLAAIQASAELLAEETPPGDARHTDIRTILDASSSGMRLARQLLDFARRPSVSRESRANVHDVLAGLDWLTRSLRTHGVTCRVVADASRPWVNLPATHVEQVLSNLITNARESMPAGGPIEVVTRDASKSDIRSAATRMRVESPAWLCLSVEDSGAGIPESILPGIFEPFVSTKDASLGTGLGLATCYSIVSGAGGFIEVTSRPGRTRFEVWLPSPE